MATPAGYAPKRPATKAHTLKGGAASAYTVASAWERTAQLNDDQLRVIDAIAQAVGQRSFPAHLSEEPTTAQGPTSVASTKGDSYVGSLEDAVLHNANQFHKWHAELEAACELETEEKYKRYADLLCSYLASCDALQGKVSATLGMFDELLQLHAHVANSSQALSGSTDTLLGEKQALLEFAEALRARLKFFDEYELAANQFAAAAAAPDNAELMPLLNRLDDCIAYVAANPQYADAVAYASKFRQLHSRALGLVRGRVQTILRQAAQTVQAAVTEAAGQSDGTAGQQGLPARAASGQLQPAVSRNSSLGRSGPVLQEGMEVSILYVRFRAVAEPVLKGLFTDLHAKSSRPEYARLLHDCRQMYCQIRLQLVEPRLSARLANLASQPLPQLVRSGTEHLLRLSQLEGQLLDQLFGSTGGVIPQLQQVRPNGVAVQAPLSTSLAEGLRPLLEPLGQLLYDILRPRFVQLADMEILAELIDILQHQLHRDQLLRRAGPGGEALLPALSRALADLQERLIYRSQAYIKDHIEGYQAKGDDLAYPAKLEAAAAKAAATASTAAVQPADEEITEVSNGDTHEPEEAPPGMWYQPVPSTLLLLSKLYRCIDTKTFAGLAQEAVAACTASVQGAGRLIARQSGGLDAQLFVIQHLLFLREQIAQFDVDLIVTDIDLDFTHMRDHVRRIMSGEVSLFTLSSSNAMVQMLGRGGPRVVAANIDSKRDLEQQLKGCCESYILNMTKAAVEPMLGFITKVTAVRLAANSNQALAKPLREQAFAAPNKLAELVTGVNTAMRERLPPAIDKTRLYLPNPATRAILFRPIKSNVAEAHGQIAQLLEKEYSPDEAAQVPLMQPDQLKAALDELS